MVDNQEIINLSEKIKQIILLHREKFENKIYNFSEPCQVICFWFTNPDIQILLCLHSEFEDMFIKIYRPHPIYKFRELLEKAYNDNIWNILKITSDKKIIYLLFFTIILKKLLLLHL